MLTSKDRIFHNIFTWAKDAPSPKSNNRDVWGLSSALKLGDWHETRHFIDLGRCYIVNQIKASGLRGRGGAGFATGIKWSFMPEKVDPRQPHYLVINADESEPGTCKDRLILAYEPHKVIEGALLTGVAIGAECGYIYIRGEYKDEACILEQAIEEAYAQGLLGRNACGSNYNFDLYIHRGAGAYICGEESALLESLEGKKGLPRLRPPFPAQRGLYNCPTTINNVETVAVVPTILRRGAPWFAVLGRGKSTGTRLFCLSGHVNNPCVVEEELGIDLRFLIDQYGGGVCGGWSNLKAIIPGGLSTPIVPNHLCQNLCLDMESMEVVGSFLATAGIIVMDQSTSMIEIFTRLSLFYKDESCGQCSPCREGTGWLWRLLNKIKKGDGMVSDFQLLDTVSQQIKGNTICGFGEAATLPILGLLKHFKDELLQQVRL